MDGDEKLKALTSMINDWFETFADDKLTEYKEKAKNPDGFDFTPKILSQTNWDYKAEQDYIKPNEMKEHDEISKKAYKESFK